MVAADTPKLIMPSGATSESPRTYSPYLAFPRPRMKNGAARMPLSADSAYESPDQNEASTIRCRTDACVSGPDWSVSAMLGAPLACGRWDPFRSEERRV